MILMMMNRCLGKRKRRNRSLYNILKQLHFIFIKQREEGIKNPMLQVGNLSLIKVKHLIPVHPPNLSTDLAYPGASSWPYAALGLSPLHTFAPPNCHQITGWGNLWSPEDKAEKQALTLLSTNFPTRMERGGVPSTTNLWS